MKNWKHHGAFLFKFSRDFLKSLLRVCSGRGDYVCLSALAHYVYSSVFFVRQKSSINFQMGKTCFNIFTLPNDTKMPRPRRGKCINCRYMFSIPSFPIPRRTKPARGKPCLWKCPITPRHGGLFVMRNQTVLKWCNSIDDRSVFTSMVDFVVEAWRLYALGYLSRLGR